MTPERWLEETPEHLRAGAMRALAHELEQIAGSALPAKTYALNLAAAAAALRSAAERG